LFLKVKKYWKIYRFHFSNKKHIVGIIMMKKFQGYDIMTIYLGEHFISRVSLRTPLVHNNKLL